MSPAQLIAAEAEADRERQERDRIIAGGVGAATFINLRPCIPCMPRKKKARKRRGAGP